MIKNHLKLTLKKNIGYLIPIGIMTISTMLVGMNLFDRHYAPGKIAGIIGFILLTTLSSVAIYLIVDKAKQQSKDTVDTNYIVRRISYTALIAGTVLIGIGLFDIGNKLGDVGFIAESLGSALIAFSVLCLTYIVVTNSKNEYQEIEPKVANSPESQKLSALDFKLQRISSCLAFS